MQLEKQLSKLRLNSAVALSIPGRKVGWSKTALWIFILKLKCKGNPSQNLTFFIVAACNILHQETQLLPGA